MHEIELKFQVPPEDMPALDARLRSAGARALAMRARYLDTTDRVLGRAGFALRLRREGDRWVQTLKGRGAGGIHRLEHNAELQGPEGAGAEPPRLDLGRHAGTPAGDALARLLFRDGRRPEDLVLRYETDFLRWVLLVEHAGARVEMALDQGAIRAAGREVGISELEFELLDGSVDALFVLVRTWVRPHGLWLDVRSKAERGDRLARGTRPPVVHPSSQGESVAVVLEGVLGQAATLTAGEGGLAHLAALVAGLDHLIESVQRGGLRSMPGLQELGGSLALMQGTATAGSMLQGVGQRLREPDVQLLWLDLLGSGPSD
jgi:triphosphatase